MFVDIIAGTRPNFVKVAALIRAFQTRHGASDTLEWRLIHTGQHYDARMSGGFFDQLGLPDPDVFLGAGGGTPAEQTGAIMLGYERALKEALPAACIVVGDVTSTMACAIVARKEGVPVAHVEAGLRSHDWEMPEETNRVITDSISSWYFTTTKLAGENLIKAGVPDVSIYFVGNTMIDTLLQQKPSLEPPAMFDGYGLSPRSYFLLTLHRPGNVDDEEDLRAILDAIDKACDGVPVVFPVHPRTSKVLNDICDYANVMMVDPMGYRQFLYLLWKSRGVITDSGGITEEATVLNVPCMTVRDNTERPETVDIGTNVLIGSRAEGIIDAVTSINNGTWKQGSVPDRWDGKAATRIVATLEDLLIGKRV